MQTYIKRLLLSLISAAVLLAAIEGILCAVMHLPGRQPRTLWALREYYDYHERRLLQYSLQTSEYSPNLGYTLRTNASIFANREFHTTIRPNSRQLRDYEESLTTPEIVCVGDSYTLGWGVDAEQRFSDVLATTLTSKVLNVSMSSYGTVREMMLLSQQDLTDCRWVILQYIHNDFAENAAYHFNTNTLPIMSRDHYDRLCRMDLETKRYYPGKYIRCLLPKIVGYARRGTAHSIVTTDYAPPPATLEVEMFVNVLLSYSKLLQGKRVIVFSINDWNLNSPEFVTALLNYISDHASDLPPCLTPLSMLLPLPAPNQPKGGGA